MPKNNPTDNSDPQDINNPDANNETAEDIGLSLDDFNALQRERKWALEERHAELNEELARIELQNKIAAAQEKARKTELSNEKNRARQLFERAQGGDTSLSESDRALVDRFSTSFDIDDATEANSLLDLRKKSLELEGKISEQKASNKHAESRKHLEAFSALYTARNNTIEKASVAIPSALRPDQIGPDLKDINWSNFSSQDAATLLNLSASNYTADGNNGIYFRLPLHQRIELLEDVVGFYSGYVFDPTNTTHPIRQSDRNLWHVPVAGVDYALIHSSTEANSSTEAEVKDGSDDLGNYPFPKFRIPQVTGYITNHYSFNLTTHQQQLSNILDWGVGATVGGGTPTGSFSAAASGAFRSADDATTMEGKNERTIHLTANFVLPKVELIRDFSPTRTQKHERLNPSFIEELTQALTLKNPAGHILNVLSDYGHFAARSVSVGGRLIAFQSKQLTEAQTATSASNQHLIAAKAAMDSVYVNASAEMDYTKGERDQGKSHHLQEVQALQFRAVGGQGDLITNPALWSRSMTDYKTWREVESRGMYPSVLLLPEDLQKKVLSTLSEFIDRKWVSDLLKMRLHFMFQGGYFDILGSRAQFGYFVIRNAFEQDLVLTIPDELNTGNLSTAGANRGLFFAKEDPEKSLNQQWFITASHITSRGHWNDKKMRDLMLIRYKDWTMATVAHIQHDKNPLDYMRWSVSGRNGDGTVTISPMSQPRLALSLPKLDREKRDATLRQALFEENLMLERQRWLLDFI